MTRLKGLFRAILVFISILAYTMASAKLVIEITSFSEEGLICWLIFTVAYSASLGVLAISIKE